MKEIIPKEKFKKDDMAEGLLKKCRSLYEKIPSGNSKFQEQKFTDGEEGLYARLRTVVMQVLKHEKALNHNVRLREDNLIDVEEAEYNLSRINDTTKPYVKDGVELDEVQREFEKKRILNHLKRVEYHLQASEHLYKDCLNSLDIYFKEATQIEQQIIKRDGKCDIEGFDKESEKLYRIRLCKKARMEFLGTGRVNPGVMDALTRINILPKTNTVTGKIVFQEMTEDEKRLLLTDDHIVKVQDRIPNKQPELLIGEAPNAI